MTDSVRNGTTNKREPKYYKIISWNIGCIIKMILYNFKKINTKLNQVKRMNSPSDINSYYKTY